MMETGAPRAGVAGWPVEHSRSPMIHRYWLEELGIAGTYEKFAVRPGEFRAFTDRIGQDGLVGANVTVPHKEAAFNACDQRTPVAEALGAVNTLWRQDGRLMGDNTDVAGFLANMDESVSGWAEQRRLAVVMGAGGAARAIVHALISRGFERIAVANRTQARAEALAAHFGGSTTAIPWADLAAKLTGADLLVNASSLGMVGQPPLLVDLDGLPDQRRRRRRRLCAFAHPAYRSRGRAWPANRGGARHAAPPGRACFRPLVRQRAQGDAGTALACRGRSRQDLRGPALIVVGLTGSIAMGKSTVSAMFAELGVPTFDADDAVRDFYAGEGAATIEAAFPGVVVSGQVDRERLGARVLGDAGALQRLEGLVHPAVAEARSRFLEGASAAGKRIVLVDVPLLFETGGEANVDLVIVVSAPESIQRDRVLGRAGMTEAKLHAILSRQMPDAEKRRRAHFVIDTRGRLELTRAVVAQFIRSTAAMAGGRTRHA